MSKDFNLDESALAEFSKQFNIDQDGTRQDDEMPPVLAVSDHAHKKAVLPQSA